MSKNNREFWQTVALCAASALILFYIFWQQHGPGKVRGEILAGSTLAQGTSAPTIELEAERE